MQTELQDYFNRLCCPAPVVTYNFDVDSSDWAGSGITDQASFDSTLGVTTSDFLLSGNNIKANILTTTGNTLELKSKTLTNVNYITVSGLQNLQLSDNQLTTFNPTIALPSSLQQLKLHVNQITTFNPTIALPSSLEFLNLYGNQIVNFNPTLPLPTSLQILNLNINQLTTFNPTIALPSSLQILYLNNNQMTTSGYTASEPWANGIHTAPSGGTILFQGNTNSASGTNLEAILISKGWNVLS